MKFFQLTFFLLVLSIIPFALNAQEGRQTIEPERSSASFDGQPAVSFGLGGKEHISGLQLDISYDPSALKPDLEDCLAGVPQSHRGEFSVCRAIPEKGLVRVIIMDLGRNRILSSDKALGTVKFYQTNFGKKRAANTSPSVSNVLLAGPDGKEADVDVGKVFFTSIN